MDTVSWDRAVTLTRFLGPELPPAGQKPGPPGEHVGHRGAVSLAAALDREPYINSKFKQDD